MPHMLYQTPPGLLYLALVFGYLTQISFRMQFWMAAPEQYIGMIVYICYTRPALRYTGMERCNSLWTLCSSLMNLLWSPDCFWRGVVVAFGRWVGVAGVPGEAARRFPVIIWGLTTDPQLNWQRNRDTEKYCLSPKITTCAIYMEHYTSTKQK